MRTLFFLVISLCLTGCVKSGYNPSFIILDRGEGISLPDPKIQEAIQEQEGSLTESQDTL